MTTTVKVLDNFVAADNTSLATHSGEVGASWSIVSGYSATLPTHNALTDFIILGNALTTANNLGGSPLAPSGGTSLSTNYRITSDISFIDGHTASMVWAFAGDNQTGDAYGVKMDMFSSDSGYCNFSLYRYYGNGDVDLLGSSSSQPCTPDVTHTVAILFNAGLITVRYDSVLMINVTDTALSGGQFFIYLNAMDYARLDYVELEDLVAPPTPPVPTGGTFLSPIFNAQQLLNNNGQPISGGKIVSTIAGTNTPYATYSDTVGLVPNTNPIILDSNGRTPVQIRLAGGATYKLTITDADDTVIWTEDNVKGVNDVNSGTTNTIPFWILFNVAPSRVNDTTFSLPGNYSSILHIDRRVQLIQNGSPIYGTVVSCVVTEPTPGSFVTTTELVLDSGTINSTVNHAYYSAIDSVGNPVPPDAALTARVAVLEAQMVSVLAAIPPLEAEVAQASPVGSIIPWSTSGSIPDGWVDCNGQALNRTTDAALYAVIGSTWGNGDGFTTFNVPDFRGMFLRGWDEGAGIDPARVFASYQADSLKSHNHAIWGDIHDHNLAGAGVFPTVSPVGLETWVYSENTGGTETVPKNKAVMFIIRTGTGGV